MASLVITQGAGDGRQLPLTAKLVSLGRDDACDFQILDERVSRKHLQVRAAPEGGHIAADYRSANGVFLNDVRISEDAPLRDGDRIRIGDTTLVYLADEHATPEEAVAAARKKGEWKRSTLIR